MADHFEQQESDDRTDRFMELFSRSESRVKTYILALLPNWADADDVFAETNVRLWKQFDDYDSKKDFGAWACTIAHYQVLSHRSKLRRNRKVLSDAFFETVSQSMPDALERNDHLLDALRGCLEKLIDRHRTILRETYAESRSIAEIAESLGLTPNSLSAKLYRIRRKLHECVRTQLRAEDPS